jgi:hypothetical protein
MYRSFELIEEIDSNSWLLCCSLCTDDYAHLMFASCYTFSFICCVCDFMLSLESERKKE